MNRKTFLKALAAVPVAPMLLTACDRPNPAYETISKTGLAAAPADTSEIEKLRKSPEKWRQILSSEEFAVLREEATEPAYSSPLLKEKRRGTFICAGCFLPLFDAETKFESGTGWPSFYTYIDNHMGTKVDNKLAMPRTEYHCARCGGHQGHVFDDYPTPTGLRYCNNGIALDFVPENEPLPTLRS